MKKLILLFLLLLCISANAKDQNNDQNISWVSSNYTNFVGKSKVLRISTNAINTKATLSIQCKEKKLELLIDWNKEIVEKPDVTTVVDKKTKETLKWNNSTKKDVTYSRNVKQQIEKIMKTDKFSAQVISKNKGSITAIFNVKGLAVELVPLTKMCKQ